MQSDKLVKEILSIVKTLNEHDMGTLSPDTLSRLAVKLASYKAGLGEYVADAKLIALNAEADYKLAQGESYKKLRDEDTNSTDSKEMKNLGAHDQFVAWNKARYNYELISNLHKDCHDLIDGIKSRLIHLQQERGESNVY